MGKVYANALCNIAATGSSNAAGGLYLNLEAPQPSFFTSMSDNAESGQQLSWAEVPSSLARGRMEDQPLFTRGWVIQERILAPRMLHFTSDDVWWECDCLQASTAFPDGIPDAILERVHSPLRDLRLSNPDRGGKSSELSVEQPLRQWKIIVSVYTACKLTYPSDRLVAISGLAQRFEP